MKYMQKEFIIASGKTEAMKTFESGKYICYQSKDGDVFFHKNYLQDKNHVEDTLRKLPKRGLWWIQK